MGWNYVARAFNYGKNVNIVLESCHGDTWEDFFPKLQELRKKGYDLITIELREND